MKTTIIATFALAAGLAGLASTANADTRISFNLGVVARPAPVIVSENCPPAAPVVTAPVGYGYNGYSYNYTPARGHWETVTTKVWVPERWVASRDRWGRPIRVLERGHFAFRTERVWVDHGHGDYGRPGYGYRG
jgi:hypothetical protein